MSDVYALEVQTLFRGVPIASKQLVRDRARRPRALFLVGSAPRADAPVAPDYLGPAASDGSGPATHPLVTAAVADGHYAVSLAPRMTSALARSDGSSVASQIGALAGADFVLGPGDRARVECGAITFLLESAPRAPGIATPGFGAGWRSQETRYHLGSGLAITVALLALLSVPEDPRALALDFLERDHGWAPILIKPPVVSPIVTPAPAALTTAEGRSPAGAPAREAAGQAGSETARAAHRRASASGQRIASLIPRTSPTPAEIARMGILEQLARAPAARAIFARESPFGDNAEDVLGDLSSAPIGEASGHSGLEVLGTGRGGAGENEGTLGGGGPLATIGKAGGGGGDGWRHGDKVAGLRNRDHPREPALSTGPLVVKGGLDREIIRRIIRRRLNEVKFCYEQALVTQPGLGGRVLVRFAIAPTGQVLSSVVESSTLGNPRVELCTAQAVRRWEFPRPTGGGMVMVSYPFVMAPAGGGP
ncbi:MAG TPA: AgmX/PglI C-terminal domain-containing protein [Polyangia bacterium]|jgi:TonB family protein|nr:AgmX/PglI C-terminal domain-containing protein [Polyangia bacterium]